MRLKIYPEKSVNALHSLEYFLTKKTCSTANMKSEEKLEMRIPSRDQEASWLNCFFPLTYLVSKT